VPEMHPALCQRSANASAETVSEDDATAHDGKRPLLGDPPHGTCELQFKPDGRVSCCTLLGG